MMLQDKGLVLQYGGIASTVGGSASLVNTADDLAGELTGQTPIKLTLGEQNGAVFKTGLSALSLFGGSFGFSDAPLRTTATVASDILGGAINLNQCLNESKTTN